MLSVTGFEKNLTIEKEQRVGLMTNFYAPPTSIAVKLKKNCHWQKQKRVDIAHQKKLPNPDLLYM